MRLASDAALHAAFRQIDLRVRMCGLRLRWCQSDSEHGGQRAAEDVVILCEAESCCRDVLPCCASAMSCCRDVLLLTASKHRAVTRAFTPHELVGVGSERCVMDFVPAVGQEHVGDVVNVDCQAHDSDFPHFGFGINHPSLGPGSCSALVLPSRCLARRCLDRRCGLPSAQSCVSQYRPASVSECCVEDQAMLNQGLAQFLGLVASEAVGLKVAAFDRFL